jgi:type IV pilus assembly protein PilO
MTAGGDFVPGDPNELEGPSYPKLFGLTLTPTVSGALVALLGLGAAIWLWVSVVQPTLERNRELKQDVAAKQQQLENQAETQQRIEEARAELAEAQQLQAEVLSLFATERSLDTLLLDVNERVQSANAGVQNPDRRAVLARFNLDPEASGVVDDSAYGEAVNNKLERRVYNVSIQGSFPQVVSIIRSIERLQPLLVVSNLNSQLDPSAQRLVINGQGQAVSTAQPEPRITTNFRLEALVPVGETAAATPEVEQEASPEEAQVEPSPSP